MLMSNDFKDLKMSFFVNFGISSPIKDDEVISAGARKFLYCSFLQEWFTSAVHHSGLEVAFWDMLANRQRP